MKRHLLFKSLLLLCALIVGSGSVWGQSDKSAVYTSNVTLPSSGTNVSSCSISIGGNSYDGTKLGKSGSGASASITAPIGTRYIHLHVAAWNAKSPGFTYKVGTGSATSISGITSNTGIANSSPFTWGTSTGNSNPNSTDHYKVIDLGTALESATVITFASTSERVVFWGVNTENAPVAITSIAFSEPKTASVSIGGTTTLAPTVLPANYTETVDWESDATGVATVSSTGVVTGVAAGTAHITAKSHGNPSTIYDVCTVTVTAPVAVTGVTLKSSTTLLLGGTETLEATVLPNDATNKNVTWASADDTKVTVDENGVITGVALTNGTPVNITVTTEDGGFKAVCAVTVNPVPVSSVGLNKSSATLKVGKTLTLEATVLPENATNKNVTWESDDESIATVDEDGEVTAVAAGTAIITAKSVADPTKSATCTFTITDGAIDLSTTGEIEITTFPSFSGSGYKNANPYTIGDYDWIATDCMLSSSNLQMKASSGKLTSPTIKSKYGFTVTTTITTNSVTISDGTNSASTSNGSASLTTSKTSTTITIAAGSKYAVVSKITITPILGPSDPTTSGDETYLTTSDNMAGWRAFYDASNSYSVDGNTKVYVANADPSGDVITLKAIEGIPANVPVILHTSSSADSHKMTLTKETASPFSYTGTNKLIWTTEAVSNKYRLGFGASDVGFYPYSGTPASGAVILDVSSAVSARELTIDVNDDVTGIRQIENGELRIDNSFYNLNGQKVQNPTKGLYILNGKKVIIK